MQKTIDAVYADGVLRPLQPVSWIPDNSTVKITIEVEARRPFTGWVGGVSDEDAALMRAAIEEEYERVDTDE